MFKTKGGVKGFLNNVQKTADLAKVATPNDNADLNLGDAPSKKLSAFISLDWSCNLWIVIGMREDAKMSFILSLSYITYVITGFAWEV